MLGLGLKNKFFNWTTIVERLTLELKKKKKKKKKHKKGETPVRIPLFPPQNLKTTTSKP